MTMSVYTAIFSAHECLPLPEMPLSGLQVIPVSVHDNRNFLWFRLKPWVQLRLQPPGHRPPSSSGAVGASSRRPSPRSTARPTDRHCPADLVGSVWETDLTGCQPRRRQGVTCACVRRTGSCLFGDRPRMDHLMRVGVWGLSGVGE